MNKRWLGLFLVIIGSVLWGSSGTITDFMINEYQTSPEWLVTTAFIASGIMLLGSHKVIAHHSVLTIWHDKTARKALIYFGICGMMPTQLLYFIAIRFSNAATATILQFTGPVFIIFYLAIKGKKLPSKLDIFSVIIAISGTVLLATRGHLDTLAISVWGLLFGLSSGIASSIYTLLPVRLLKKYPPQLLCGWGFLLGSIPLMPFLFQRAQGHFNGQFISAWTFVIVGGTMFAYLFYVASINYLTPTISGVLASFEPLTATFLSVFLLHLKLNSAEIIGIILILLMAFIQALPQKKP